MPNNSMAPTILAGDYLLARPLLNLPARNQLVIYRSESEAFVMRVAALSGDTVSMQAGILSVNGATVQEPHTIPEDIVAPAFSWQRSFLARAVDTTGYRPTLNSWGPLVVPAGHCFVLADNRGMSADSRYIGFIPLDAVVEEPTSVYFSKDPDAGTVRWSRIGHRLADVP
jgi:signal peptidase I